MKSSNWENLLQHLGIWNGSFTRLSPQGTMIEDMPTTISFETLNDGQTVRQTNQYAPVGNRPAETRVLEYSSLGRGVLFFSDGSFSQGSLQFSPISEFGAELGFIQGDRRLRLVQLFNPVEAESRLTRLTLIREQRQGTDAPERPPLTLDDLLGTWVGEVTTLYADGRSPDTTSSQLTVEREGDRLLQHLSTSAFGLQSTARINGNLLHFDQGSTPMHLLLLPDGASSNTPVTIPRGRPFLLEAGWMPEPGLRLRLIRSYDARGGWVSLTLVTERKEV